MPLEFLYVVCGIFGLVTCYLLLQAWRDFLALQQEDALFWIILALPTGALTVAALLDISKVWWR